jgi:hypothetical protein
MQDYDKVKERRAAKIWREKKTESHGSKCKFVSMEPLHVSDLIIGR